MDQPLAPAGDGAAPAAAPVRPITRADVPLVPGLMVALPVPGCATGHLDSRAAVRDA